MLIRRAEHPGRAPLVLLLGRPSQASFAPGIQAFPGGSVDEADRDPAWEPFFAPALTGSWDKRASLPVRIAAIRETYEECGVLLAQRRGGEPCTAQEVADLGPYRDRIRQGEPALFRTALAAADLLPAVGRIVFCADWVTPEGLPRRFDARFFVTALPAAQEPLPDPLGEHESLRWVDPHRALEEAMQGTTQLLPPTRSVLSELAHAGSVAEALQRAESGKVETVRPRLEDVTAEHYPGLDVSRLRQRHP
jgi:8-oxo-dGTP pyrophosphatase MutT (NUDIX family)